MALLKVQAEFAHGQIVYLVTGEETGPCQVVEIVVPQNGSVSYIISSEGVRFRVGEMELSHTKVII